MKQSQFIMVYKNVRWYISGCGFVSISKTQRFYTGYVRCYLVIVIGDECDVDVNTVARTPYE